MASPLAVYKLTILYMLDRINGPIALSRITEFLLENGYVNFVSLNQTLAEIEESGLVRSETRRDGIFLYITQEGTETLNFFSGSLSDEIKGQVDEYLRDKGMELRNDHYLAADYDRSVSGAWLVHMSVREKNETIIDLTLSVPDEETARQAADSWKEKSQEIYTAILDKLF